MIDRTEHAAQGLRGGRPGALGAFRSGSRAQLPPKTVVSFDAEDTVHLELPGGGGYGDPFARQPEHVLQDVVEGFVSIEAATREYGVVVHFLGTDDQLVRLPHHYAIDWEATQHLRAVP